MPVAASAGLSLADIAARLGGDVLGDPQTLVFRVATLASAGEGDIAFLANPKYRSQLQTTAAAAVIVAPDAAEGAPCACIVTRNPYAYYARVAALLNPAPSLAPGVHASAACASPVPADAFIGPHVSIGAGVVLGDGVVIHAGCVLADDVEIGAGTVLQANVTVYAGCRIGARCIIHSGTVIGADGFGFAPDAGRWIKIPQTGRVVIGDDVEIGANTTVDRGALDDTVIGDGCKLDNQIQIAHNCVIGRNCVIAGCTALAGSVCLEDNVIIGGAAMIAGHLTIASGVTVSGGSFVTKSIRKPGQYTALFPLDEHGEWARNAAHVRHLARLAERVTQLEKKLNEEG